LIEESNSNEEEKKK